MKNKKDVPRHASTVPLTPRLDAVPHLQRYKLFLKLTLRLPVVHPRTPGGHLDGLLLSIRLDLEALFYLLYLTAAQQFRGFYNDFTTIDWAKAYVATNRFNYGLRHSRYVSEDNQMTPMLWWHKCYFVCGRWVLIVVISLLFSLIAYAIDKVEILFVGVKYGYCRDNWFVSQVTCCAKDPFSGSQLDAVVFGVGPGGDEGGCLAWVSWEDVFEHHPSIPAWIRLDFLIYVGLSVGLAVAACYITLTTKIVGGSALAPENGGASEDDDKVQSGPAPQVMYTACGLGVPEVKTILLGFVIRRFLGTYTLVSKACALVLAIALGMSLGKEGPYVHLATCVGNISLRLFPYINANDLFRKQILSAAALAGVALAFGSPLGGVLFILEEINHYLPSHQLFQIFFCAICSTLFLKFLNPYGTGKTVLFELKYDSDWRSPELVFFVIIGVAGGVFGAAFIKFVFWWPKWFRSRDGIKNHPVFEVTLVALATGLATYWNIYTKQALLELVLDLATPCSGERDRSLCPGTVSDMEHELLLLTYAFGVKLVLTFITFGLKLPCGIYVPLMVAGALFGRIFASLLQLANFHYNLLVTDAASTPTVTSVMRFVCSKDQPECVDMGIYAMILAGAFMAGVTRMNITLVTILFELTSSYTYVLPISIAIAVANWIGGLLEPHSLYERLLIANDYPFMTLENEAVDPFVTSGEIITDMDLAAADGHQSQGSSKNPNPPQDPDSGFRRLLVITSLATNTDNKLLLDVTELPYVLVLLLESKLALLADHNLLDGCLPLVRHQLCVGVIHYSELDFCLDRIREFAADNAISDELHCKLVDDDDKYYHNKRTVMMQQRRYNDLIIDQLVLRAGGVPSSPQDYFSCTPENTLAETPDTMLATVQLQVRAMFDLLTDLVPYVEKHPIFLNHDSEMSFANLIFDRIGNRVIVLLREGKYYGILHKKVLIDYCRRQH